VTPGDLEQTIEHSLTVSYGCYGAVHDGPTSLHVMANTKPFISDSLVGLQKAYGNKSLRHWLKINTMNTYDRQQYCWCSPASSHRKRGDSCATVGRSRGGLTTKIHLCTDEEGKPIRFHLTQGQRNDCTQGPKLLHGLKCRYMLADKGYDSQQVLDG